MYKKKIKRDFFIIVFCGMKAHSLLYLFVCLFKDMFLLYLRCYSSENNLSSAGNLFRKLEESTAICWAVSLNKHRQLH